VLANLSGLVVNNLGAPKRPNSPAWKARSWRTVMRSLPCIRQCSGKISQCFGKMAVFRSSQRSTS
jgi:hypothetical protein